jgi:hypothetical protein
MWTEACDARTRGLGLADILKYEAATKPAYGSIAQTTTRPRCGERSGAVPFPS